MRIIITGATGFIGKALCQELTEAGYEVVALTRNREAGVRILGDKVKLAQWDGKTVKGRGDLANGAYAIVNLAGENISSGRWTEKRKKIILESRLNAGKAVVEAVKQAKEKPKVVVQASGIGYYGSLAEKIADEEFPPGKGFLPELAQQWELSTKAVELFGVRHIVIRSGIVLGKGGGAFPRLINPFRFFVGGRIGNGEQWFSWIPLKDEIRAIRFLIENENLEGVFNLTAPEALKEKDFAAVLGKVMRRPSWFPVPGFVLRLLFGEMAQVALLTGQRVTPKRLLAAGFDFLYPEAEIALREILGKR
ncbi:MAG TPA: TIGR01777 family oxidoreductase [Terriglobales bacterium]|nr:TIGR01777 family oxidoreductase [Terriglobales bacterium]